MKTKLVKISELKKGDLFSFRTIMRPIFWRFVNLCNDIIVYEEIRSNYPHTSERENIGETIVLKKFK